MNEHVIYGLFDPETNQLRYIGYTSNTKSRYMSHHRLSSLKYSTHKNHWLKSLIAKGQKAEMFILETYQTAEELPQAEIELVEYYKSIGCDLVNGTKGGDGIIGYNHSDETKLKMSKSRRGKPSNKKGVKLSEEHKLKLAIASSGKKFPGRKLSIEHKRKISEALKSRSH